jgi:hypothetical protein
VSVLIILAVTWLVFSPVLDAQFLNYDDPEYVTVNPAIRGFDADHVHRIWTRPMTGNYSPLTVQSYAVEYALFGLNPRVYHATNLLLHTANAVLLFFLCRRLLEMVGRPVWWASAVIAVLFFAIHPLRVEPVAWVTARKDLLSLTFYLIAVLVYLSHLKALLAHPPVRASLARPSFRPA